MSGESESERVFDPEASRIRSRSNNQTTLPFGPIRLKVSMVGVLIMFCIGASWPILRYPNKSVSVGGE
jgi:hypothetical protein